MSHQLPSSTHTPFTLTPSRRVRRTPFSHLVEKAGVRAYTVYNHMLLASAFRPGVEDYTHLSEHVQIWDVSCERQVEVTGPDAAALIQWATPRDLSKIVDLQCAYAPLVDENGGIINDPVIIRLNEDRYWLSIADTDVLLWMKGLALGSKLDVEVFEPNVYPLAIQGPKSDILASRIFGEAIRSLRFFRSGYFDFQDHQLLIARSGWSKQGGFEIYLDKPELAEPLWNALFSAGQDLNVGPGCPNSIERIEGALLSYGSDMRLENNPYECGLDKYCHPDRVKCLGREALLKIMQSGPARQIRGVRFDTDNLPPCTEAWTLLNGKRFAGNVTSATISPRFGAIGLAMIEREFWHAGTKLQLDVDIGQIDAKVVELPFG